MQFGAIRFGVSHMETPSISKENVKQKQWNNVKIDRRQPNTGYGGNALNMARATHYLQLLN